MRSVKAARTRKKNSLVMAIGSATELLTDLAVPAHRLEDIQTVVKDNWFQYEASQESLEALLDDDGNIDVGQEIFDGLMKQVMNINLDLNAGIKQRKTAIEDAAREEEKARQDLEKTDQQAQLAAQKVRDDAATADAKEIEYVTDNANLASLYLEVKAKTKVAVDEVNTLAAKETPISGELERQEKNLFEILQLLNSADAVVKDLSMRKPIYVDDLQQRRLRERDAFNVEYQKALRVLDGIRHRCPGLAAAASGGGSSGHSKGASLHFKKSEFPKFKGTLREFPSFKDDWQSMVASEFSEKMQLHHLKDCVPVRDKVFVETCTNMADFWVYMTGEYGKTEELVTDRLVRLSKYTFPKEAKTDFQKFKDMHQVFKEVYADMTKMGLLDILNHPQSIKDFMRNLPATSQGEYVKYRLDHPDPTVMELNKIRNFMEVERRRIKLVEEVFGSDSKESNPLKPKGEFVCHNCDKPGHKAKDCPAKKSGAGKDTFKSHSGVSNVSTPVKPPCPVCKKKHVFSTSAGKELNSTRLSSCSLFQTAKTADQRAKILQEAKGCIRCLDWTGQHQVEDCKASEKTIEKCSECNLKHSAWVHHSSNPYTSHRTQGKIKDSIPDGNPRPQSAVGTVDDDNAKQFILAPTTEQIRMQEVESANVMFLMERVKVLKQNSNRDGIVGNVFWDIGGNGTMVRNDYAKELGLEGTDVMQTLVRTGGDATDLFTKAYHVRVKDRNGEIRVMLALGQDKISSPIDEMDVSTVKDLFPGMDGLGNFKRPHGEIDLMIGMNYLELMPKEVCRVKGLGLWESQLGKTKLISGTHPSLNIRSMERLTDEAQLVKQSVSHAMYVVRGPEIKSHRTQSEIHFLEAEELAVMQPPRCDRCRNCCMCSAQAQYMSRVESVELAMIQANMKIVYDKPGDECGKLYFQYPTKGDLNTLKDNRSQAIGFQTGVAKKLSKEEREVYNEEMHGYLGRGTFHKFTPEEMAEWKGAVNYVTHHGVHKPGSKTTALRLVSNSSLRNNMSQGVSLNDLLVKGPNSLLPIIQVQIDFRTLRHVVIWDYLKAYNTVHTYKEELNVRRLVHRDNDDEEWQTYGIDRMHFGDKPAAAGLEVAKELVANKGEDICVSTVAQLKRGYVDDGIGGGSSEMVEKLVGKETYDEESEKWEYSGTVAKIMKRGNFRIKFMIQDGETREALLELYGGKVLGLPWVPGNDTLEMKMCVNLWPRKRGIRTGPDVTLETLHTIDESSLTRRIILSQVHGIYDPLGLLSPITIKYKLLLQKIVEAGLAWDESLVGDLLKEAQSVLKEMVESGTVIFHRCAVGDLWNEGGFLAGFWDGGNPASACCLYACTPLKSPGPNGEVYEVKLLAGKARVTPTSKKNGRLRASTPRTEMRGLLMLSRLTDCVLPGFQVLPSSIYLAGDSQSTISCVEADHRVLETWYTNRVGEVVDNISKWEKKGITVFPLEHWPGDRNVADIATKGRAQIKDIQKDSEWQSGPAELKFSRENWPGSRDFVRKLPGEMPVELELRSHANHFFGTPQDEKSSETDQNINVTPEKSKIVQKIIQIPSKDSKEVEEFMSGPLWKKKFYLFVIHQVKLIMSRTNRIKKAIGVVARLLQLVKRKVDLNNWQDIEAALRQDPDAAQIKKAEKLLFLVASFETAPLVKNMKRLDPVQVNGVWGCRGRLGKAGLMKIVGQSFLPILPMNSALARLIMFEAHEANHDMVDGTLAGSRSKAWIVRGRYLARSITSRCYYCNFDKFKLQQQRMGDLPMERVSPNCKPFQAICTDLFGPYLVKAMVNKKAEMKSGPSCLSARLLGLCIAN